MWIEPTREWIKEASILDETAKTADLPSKKLFLQKIFGSNLLLHGREASGNPLPHYAALRSARQNFAKKDETLIRVLGGRFALPTLRSSGECSNYLSYPSVPLLHSTKKNCFCKQYNLIF